MAWTKLPHVLPNIEHKKHCFCGCDWWQKKEREKEKEKERENINIKKNKDLIETTMMHETNLKGKQHWRTTKCLSRNGAYQKAKALDFGESATLRVSSMSFLAFLLLISILMLSLFSTLSYSPFFTIFKHLILDFKLTINLPNPILFLDSAHQSQINKSESKNNNKWRKIKFIITIIILRTRWWRRRKGHVTSTQKKEEH